VIKHQSLFELKFTIIILNKVLVHTNEDYIADFEKLNGIICASLLELKNTSFLM